MTTRRSTAPIRRLADVGAGSIVLAVVGAADAESLDDLMMKAHALLTFEGVTTLVIDVRATTRISDDAADRFVELMWHARSVQRSVRFAGVPDRLCERVATIERLGASGSDVVLDG